MDRRRARKRKPVYLSSCNRGVEEGNEMDSVLVGQWLLSGEVQMLQVAQKAVSHTKLLVWSSGIILAMVTWHKTTSGLELM